MKTFVITAGHSNVDHGAVANGLKEAALAVELRDIVASKLREKGYEVITDGLRGDNKPLNDAIKLIPRGDVAVELHFNAAASTTAAGVETIALLKHNGDPRAESRRESFETCPECKRQQCLAPSDKIDFSRQMREAS